MSLRLFLKLRICLINNLHISISQVNHCGHFDPCKCIGNSRRQVLSNFRMLPFYCCPYVYLQYVCLMYMYIKLFLLLSYGEYSQSIHRYTYMQTHINKSFRHFVYSNLRNCKYFAPHQPPTLVSTYFFMHDNIRKPWYNGDFSCSTHQSFGSNKVETVLVTVIVVGLKAYKNAKYNNNSNIVSKQ